MTEQPSQPRPARLGRRVVRVGAVLGLAVVLPVVAVHLPFARTRVLDRVRTMLASSGIELEASRLQYNLFSLSFALDDVRLTAAGADERFLTADRIAADVPWAALTGTLRVQAIELVSPRVTIVRSADGSTNLPVSTADDTGPGLRQVAIERVSVQDLDVRYVDVPADLEVALQGIDLSMSPSADVPSTGQLTMAEPGVIEQGGRSTQISALEGTLNWDGSTLGIADLRVTAPELDVRSAGHVDLLGPDPDLDIDVVGTLDVERAAAWVDLPATPSGVLDISAAVTGNRSSPAVAIQASSAEMAWPEVGTLALVTRASLDGTALHIESARVDLGSGRLDADGRIGLGAGDTSAIDARWTRLDLGRLAGLVPGVPVTLASTGDGQLSASWVGTDVRHADASLTTTLSSTEAPADRLSLAGTLGIAVLNGEWTLTASQRVGEAIDVTVRASGRLQDELTESTMAGQATIVVPAAAAALDRLVAVGMVKVPNVAIGGQVTTTLALGGTIASPQVAAAIDGQNLAVNDVGPARLHAELRASGPRVTIESLRVDLGSNVVTAAGSVNIQSGGWQGTMTGELADLDAIAEALPAAWRPAGASRIEGQFSGTIDNPAASLIVTSADLDAAGQQFQNLRAELSLADRNVTLTSLDIAQASGRLQATGEYNLDTRAYVVSATGRSLSLDPIPTGETGDGLPIDANVDFEIRGAGTLDDLQATATLDVSALSWNGYALGAMRMDASISGGTADFRAAAPSLGASATARLAVDSGAVDADLVLDDSALGPLLRSTGPAATGTDAETASDVPVDLDGTVSLTAHVSGLLSDLGGLGADVTLERVEATVGGVPIQLASSGRLVREGAFVTVDELDLRLGESRLLVAGALGASAPPGSTLRLSLAGTLADFIPLARLAPGAATLEADGRIAVAMEASGPLETPDITGTLRLDDAHFATPEVPAVALDVNAAYADGVLEVSTISGSWQGAAISGTGSVPIRIAGEVLPATYLASLPPNTGLAHLQLRATELSPEALAAVLPPDTLGRMTGRVDAAITLDADALTLDALAGSVVLEQADVTLAGVSLAQTRPTRLALADGRLSVVDWSWTGPTTSVDVNGFVDVVGETPALDLDATGTIDLRLFNAFVPDFAVTGTATFDVSATGSARDPNVTGQLAVSGGGLALRDPRLAITDVSGSIAMTAGRLELSRLTASANGGDISGSGSVAYDGLALTGGALTLVGRGIALEPVDGLRTELDVDLELVPVGEQATLGGTVTIVQGDYREVVRLTEQLLAARTEVIPTADEAAVGLLDRLRLNIAIASAGDIVVDNNYGALDVGVNLRIIGTAAEPAVAGRLTVREGGEVFLGGRTYTVRRGAVDFTNPVQIEPTLDIALETRVREYDITLQVTGTPETLEVGVISPGLSQPEAVSLLLTGEVADASTIAYSEVARGQLIMLLSGEVLGLAGRAVGLDSVQVSSGLGGAASTFDLLATESDPGARLTLSKNLSRSVELIVSQSLRESGDVTWIVGYRPLRRIELRASTDDSNRESYEFRHEIPFGGRDESTPAELARPAPLVASVEVRAASGTSVTGLEDLPRVRAGDRFDFYAGQRDRDRLLAHLHERDYYEARVDVGRQPAGPNSLALVYDVAPGPHTTFHVEGFDLPAAVVADMRHAWIDAVFDGFLVDDLERLARAALVADGYLQNTVAVRIDLTGRDEKVVTIAIAPGRRVADRRVTFAGNAHVPDETLRAVLETRGLESDAWIDPEAAAQALETHYRSLGYLAADVSVGEPTIAGSSATLIVQVDEGPVHRIGRIAIKGAATQSDEAMLGLAALAVGTAYLPAAIEPARRRVELSYLSDGFNDVRVTAAVRLDEASATVDVTLTIDEGPQQVLTDVSITGNDVTSTATVDRAVDLELGRPLDLGTLYRAQKRLYDVGVFSTVDVSVEPIEPAGATAGLQPVRARIALTELPRYRFRYGLRAIDEPSGTAETRPLRFGFVADLLNRNVFGRAISAGVAGQVETDRWLARAVVSLPTLGPWPIVTNVFVTRSRQTFTPEAATPYVGQATEVTAEQRFEPAADMTVTYGYTLGRTRVYEPEPDPGALIPLDFRTRVARLTGTWAWDTRDDPANATTGWFHSSGVEYGPEALGSTLRFVRYLAQQYVFRTVGDRLVLASAARLGLARGIGQDLIPTERFFAGGATSVRGFGEDALGPVDFLGDPVGGGGLILLNHEARVRLHPWVSLVGFVDAGNVYPQIRAIRLGDLAVGTGLGLRLNSPFAIVRLDISVPLTSGDGQRRARWYFGIGQTF